MRILPLTDENFQFELHDMFSIMPYYGKRYLLFVVTDKKYNINSKKQSINFLYTVNKNGKNKYEDFCLYEISDIDANKNKFYISSIGRASKHNLLLPFIFRIETNKEFEIVQKYLDK